MNTYFINLNNHRMGPVSGTEAAWDAYMAAEHLALVTGGTACLVDATTGDLLANSVGYRAKEYKGL